ncbi:D-alanyl-D-alanine carboxypeptidase [Qipengyuania sp. RS5-5]|uniref:serine-type D-Ala-D-Ala carboxypeptidase n=1 Tax=Parerythrobacter lacustris TaxID=2969984 RepID=A0ABT1XQ71_9SPHN|nr:D-alanyl-D-alanine carboxypeptidase family protein [Parerythrobacter lacustris]MCR2833815.1 D-alanyl-D-alanine carboxypeptidase [Parerythrobacter lacustris]
MKAVTTDAPVALLVDMDSGQTLVARNDRHRFIPASVTKVMTLYLAFELIDRGKLSPDQLVTMRDVTQAEWDRKGSTMFIRPGQPVSLDELLAGIAAISANDAAIALAEAAGGSVDGWTAMMNDEARKLGMRDSHFTTPNGWPDDGKTFTSARDLEVLARALIRRHPEKYKRYFGRDGLAFNGVAQANHDPITRRVRGADGIKTGFTNEAGHTFLGSAERDGTRLIMILAGVEDYEDRGIVSRELIERGFADFDRITVFRKNATIGTLSIQDGTIDRVALKASRDIRVAVPKGERPQIVLTVRYAGPVRAPISPDVAAAMLEVKIEGMEPVNFPLLPAQQVDQAGFFRRIGNGMRSWFT